MTIQGLIDAVDTREKTLTILQDEEPEPIVRMLKRMVDADAVEVQETDPPPAGPGDVVVVEDEGEEHLAISPIREFAESVLLVNQDLYITGTRPIEDVETPEVIANLSETTFTVEDKQKMLLIEISRHMESLAHAAEDATIHTGFQQLARLDDERGTRQVYETLVEEGVDVHVYGAGPVPDGLPDGVTVHVDHGEEMRRSWFVVTTDCPDPLRGALLAHSDRPGRWTGVWTYDPSIVERTTDYVTSAFPRA